MSDLKPIEPGCLCMIVKSYAGNNGKTVTVIRSIDKPRRMVAVDERWWEVDRKLPCRKISTGLPAKPSPYFHESQLMRIDGHEPDELDTETEKELELEPQDPLLELDNLIDSLHPGS